MLMCVSKIYLAPVFHGLHIWLRQYLQLCFYLFDCSEWKSYRLDNLYLFLNLQYITYQSGYQMFHSYI